MPSFIQRGRHGDKRNETVGEEALDRVRSGHPVFPPQAPASCPLDMHQNKGQRPAKSWATRPEAGQPGVSDSAS